MDRLPKPARICGIWLLCPKISVSLRRLAAQPAHYLPAQAQVADQRFTRLQELVGLDEERTGCKADFSPTLKDLLTALGATLR